MPDQAARNVEARGDAVVSSVQLADERSGNRDARHLLVQIVCHRSRFEQQHPCDHGNVVDPGRFHERGERVRLVNRLGLEESGAGFHLVCHAAEFLLPVRCPWIHHRAGMESRAAVQGCAPEVVTGLKRRQRAQQPDRVEVEDRLGFGMVAAARVVSRHTQDVADAQSRGPQQVGLQGQPVPVAAGHLHDGFDAAFVQQARDRQRRHGHSRDMGIGQITGGNQFLQTGGLVEQSRQVGPFGGVQFRRHDKVSGLQRRCQSVHTPPRFRGRDRAIADDPLMPAGMGEGWN